VFGRNSGVPSTRHLGSHVVDVALDVSGIGANVALEGIAVGSTLPRVDVAGLSSSIATVAVALRL
jgi:hypothetical protein